MTFPSDGVPKYFPALDGLRFFSASAVVVAHSFHDDRILADHGHPLHAFVANLGAAGVDVFFSLSGFLITKLLLDEVAARGTISLKNFYVRRTLRIWPVYYVALAIGFGGTFLGARFNSALAYTPHPELWTRAAPAFALFLGNWAHTQAPTSIHILWSVCVEEQFYLLFPPLLYLSRRKYPAALPIAVGLLLAWCVRGYLAATHAPPPAIYSNTFAHSDHLLLGAALAQLLHIKPRWLLGVVRRLGVVGELVSIAACLSFTAIDSAKVQTAFDWLVYYFVSALIMTSMVAMLALGNGPISRALGRPLVRWLGGLTYAAYVFHMYGIVIAWSIARRFVDGAWSAASLRAALAIPITFVIAYASKRIVEDRFAALKKRFQRT